MTLGQCDKLHTLAQKERIIADQYRAYLSTDKLRECWFEVLPVARLGDFQGLPGRTGNVFDFQQHVLIVRVYQKTDGRVSWNELPDQFKTLEDKRRRHHSYAGGVASRMSEAFREPELHRVRRDIEYDGNG